MSFSTFNAPWWAWLAIGLLLGTTLLLRWVLQKTLIAAAFVHRTLRESLVQQQARTEKAERDLQFQIELGRRYQMGFLRQRMTIRRLVSEIQGDPTPTITAEHRAVLQSLLKDVDLKDF